MRVSMVFEFAERRVPDRPDFAALSGETHEHRRRLLLRLERLMPVSPAFRGLFGHAGSWPDLRLNASALASITGLQELVARRRWRPLPTNHSPPAKSG